jgi:3-hydroxyisobutyrate dehydrogenase
MDVAVIGTGLMGRPLAERLLAGGHRVTVFNRTPERAAPLAARGARLAASAAEAVAACRCAVTMLKDAAAIRDLLFGADAADFTGRTLVQMSTIGPPESVALAADVERAGGEYLEAPVLGSTPQASEGKLLVMVGATPERFDRWLPLLRCFGPAPVRIGGVGQAAALKLALNQLIAAEAAGFALALGLVRRSGVDASLFMGILRDSALYAKTFDAKLPRLQNRDFGDPNFPVALLGKDLDLVAAEATRLGLGTAALDGVRAVLRQTVERGLGDGDYSALYAVIDPLEPPLEPQ